MHHLPAFFHQSTVITIDDDTLFSDALVSLLIKDFKVKSFEQPQSFLQHINDLKSTTSEYTSLNGCTEHEYTDTAQHTLVDFDISKLYGLINDPTRCNEISVIILDYNMPELNGLELCKLIAMHPAKKILLTGEADQNTAVSAFNKRIIDRFIRKDSTTLVSDITEAVNLLAYEYYKDKSLSILNHIEASQYTALSDPMFSTFFNNWRLKNSIREYTLIDKNGSMCVLNSVGELSYFIIHTERSLDLFTQLNEDECDVAAFLDSVAKREVIPFFGIGNDYWSIEPQNWADCFYKASIFTGREQYYWTHIQ